MSETISNIKRGWTQVQPLFLYPHNRVPKQTGMSVNSKKSESILRNSFVFFLTICLFKVFCHTFLIC